MRRLLILALALTSVCVQAQTYRWVDSTGRTVFSDTPPPGKAKANAKTTPASEPGDNLPFAVKRAAAAERRRQRRRTRMRARRMRARRGGTEARAAGVSP